VAVSYAKMFRFSLVGFLTCGLFLGRAYFDYYFAIVAFIVILKRVSFASWRNGERLGETEPAESQDEEYTEAGYAT
jgi:hypothetical protein